MLRLWALLFLCLAAETGCSRAKQAAKPAGTPLTISSPLGLPPLAIPADNPPTEETVALGKKLFFSPVLSVDGTLSCSTCHNPSFGFADPRPVSLGVHNKRGTRNAPTVVNAAFYAAQFWDGRAATLEDQVSGPMLNSLEMGHTLEGVERAVSADAELRPLFERAFGPGPATMEKITRAIASYERTLLSGNSPFDRYLYGGDKTAMTPAAVRGLAVFRDPAKGNCAVCHTIEEKHALFTDNKFHNLGVGLNPQGELTDLGRFTHTKQDADRGAFRTPSLRNIAKTAPYMHDGSLKTLKEVVDFYVGGGSSNPHLDKEIKALSHLKQQEREDLVAFMEALTGDPVEVSSGGPSRPPGQVAGVVRYAGSKPPIETVSMDADETCQKLNRKAATVAKVVTGRGGALANAVVYAKSGFPGRTFAPAQNAVVLDQRGCMFVPRVLALRTGQVLRVKNSDPVSHNIHPQPRNNYEWNQQQAPGAPDLERKFARAEAIIPVKCNIHNWMRSYIAVLDHPYFAVTGPDGRFSWPDVPAGTHTLAVWHETLGEITQPITVTEKGIADLVLTFK